MLYMSKETGEILTKKQMLEMFREEYDGEDPTNPIELDEYFEEYDDSLEKRVVEVVERLGWSVGQEDDGCKEMEFAKHSPAGEDFRFTVYYKDDDELVDEIVSYSRDFDVDEHIEMWIDARRSGVCGVPDTRTLVHDAEEIEKMLKELESAVIDERKHWNEMFPDWKEN